MKAQATVWITASLLGACAAGCSGAPEQSSADIRRLEMRVTALEGVEMQAAPRPERNRLTTGPAALRVASMRAAADFLERAELARRGARNAGRPARCGGNGDASRTGTADAGEGRAAARARTRSRSRPRFDQRRGAPGRSL